VAELLLNEKKGEIAMIVIVAKLKVKEGKEEAMKEAMK
jgi:hypothetical protein